jgi:hypothetical protein
MRRNRPPSHEEGQQTNLDTREREGKQPCALEQEDYADGPARPPQERTDPAKTGETSKRKRGRAS